MSKSESSNGIRVTNSQIVKTKVHGDRMWPVERVDLERAGIRGTIFHRTPSTGEFITILPTDGASNYSVDNCKLKDGSTLYHVRHSNAEGYPRFDEPSLSADLPDPRHVTDALVICREPVDPRYGGKPSSSKVKLILTNQPEDIRDMVHEAIMQMWEDEEKNEKERELREQSHISYDI